MIKLKPLINEIIVKDYSNNNYNFHHFLMYKGQLFLFDNITPLRTILKSLEDHVNYSYLEKTRGDFHEFIQAISESGPDIISGVWDPKEKRLTIYGYYIDPTSSLQVKKAAKALGAKIINFPHADYSGDYDTDTDYSIKKLKGKIPNIVYHGTAISELESILKYGLWPGKGSGKFIDQDIVHEDHVFFAASFHTAIFYARNAVHNSPSKKWGDAPIILELKIPDFSKIAPDFDADGSSKPLGGLSYYNHYPFEVQPTHDLKAITASLESGKWGYKGRIPAKFIRWVWYYNSYLKKWKKSKPSTWKKLLDKWDVENIIFRLGMDPESY